MASARVQSSRRTPPRDDNEHLLALEPGQCPAHRLDRQPEIVGNILPAHRQSDGLPFVADMGQSRPPADEKRRDLLFGRSPPEQKHLLLGQHQFTRREFVDPEQEMRTASMKCVKASAGKRHTETASIASAEKL